MIAWTAYNWRKGWAQSYRTGFQINWIEVLHEFHPSIQTGNFYVPPCPEQWIWLCSYVSFQLIWAEGCRMISTTHQGRVFLKPWIWPMGSFESRVLWSRNYTRNELQKLLTVETCSAITYKKLTFMFFVEYSSLHQMHKVDKKGYAVH